MTMDEGTLVPIPANLFDDDFDVEVWVDNYLVDEERFGTLEGLDPGQQAEYHAEFERLVGALNALRGSPPCTVHTSARGRNYTGAEWWDAYKATRGMTADEGAE